MKRVIFLAAALAAGSSSFAASAANSDRAAPAVAKMAAAKSSPVAKVALTQNSDRAGRAQAKAAEATKAQPAAKQAKAKERKSAAVAKAAGNKTARKPSKQVADKKPSKKATKATTQARAKMRIDPRKSQAKARKPKIEVDMTTTASVAKPAVGDAAYSAIVTRYAATYGVPASLAHAVIRVESNYRVDARGRAGEIGLMQIKPATARMMGYSGSANGLFNPETNIKFGLKYLGMAHKLGGGTTCGTILRYNAGHAAKRMNPVSAAYCSKVKRHLAS